MVRSSELEDMQSIMEQTRESIDSQTAVYASLLNYLTYSPDIEEIIKEKRAFFHVLNGILLLTFIFIISPIPNICKNKHIS